jgi:hypothetical protein
VDIHSRVTSQASYSPEYITPRQKNHDIVTVSPNVAKDTGMGLGNENIYCNQLVRILISDTFRGYRNTISLLTMHGIILQTHLIRLEGIYVKIRAFPLTSFSFPLNCHANRAKGTLKC